MGGEKAEHGGEQAGIIGAGAQAIGIEAGEGEEAGAEIRVGGEMGERLQGQDMAV
jgi:hypothetical protein